MGRPPRATAGGIIYHVLNRANARMTIFDHESDYLAFEEILGEAVERFEMRLLSYVVMPNHWHLLVWPGADGDLSKFTGWLTLTHTQRWHAHRGTTGSGHVYQGRFKSFPVAEDGHFLTVARYVERNPLRANLVKSAEAWRWGSLWRWTQGDAKQKRLLATWPVRRRTDWVAQVNQPLTKAEHTALQRSLTRNRPFGSPDWLETTCEQLGLESTLRPRGRPRKSEKGS